MMEEATVTEEDRDYAAAATDAFADRSAASAAALLPLGSRFIAEFEKAVVDKQPTEERFLQDLRQYRGVYDDATLAAIGPKRSRSFVRKTRVKVKTVDSRIADLQFPAGQEKNWTVDNTPVPSVSPETKEAVKAQLQKMAQGGQVTNEQIDEAVVKIAKQAAKGMSKVIEDQLVETRYKQTSLKAIHSGNLYGTGILKGPLVERKIRTRYEQKGGKWITRTETYVVPFLEYVPVWRFYPDMSGTELDQLQFVYEEHLFTKAQMSDLARRKTFNRDLIVEYIKGNPNGRSRARHFDSELKSLGDRESKQSDPAGKYQVIERWGWVDGCDLAQVGIDVPKDREHESFFANIWLLPDGQVIKAVLQPIDGVTWPYHLYYFDKDETSIFGEGLASIMRDDQDMLNAATRMMLDNGALTSFPMIELVLKYLANVENAEEIGPGKVYFRNSVDPGHDAVKAIQIPNNIEWLHEMAQMFEVNADETTAIPRYMSGENATNGAAGTASGMSMLMGAANIVLKDLVNSWDEGVTRPFLQALYRWNMKFSKDAAIKGDFDVKVRGTASLVAKEMRGQRLTEFNSSLDPDDRPLINRASLLRQRAEALELGDVVLTDDEIEQQEQSPESKRNKELQQQLQEAQVREIQGKAAKVMAEAEVAKKKLDEMLANIDLIIAKTVDQKVETIFAALQAGGAATRDPLTAPAGDEVLKSAGFKDATPTPPIADLNGPPVQPTQGTDRLMNKGQSFAVEPRGGQPDANQPDAPSAETPGESQPGVLEPRHTEQHDTHFDASAIAETGHVGQRAGIETTRIEA